MIGVLAKSTVLILAAWGATSLLRRRTAAVRHVVWTAGLLSALAVPVASWFTPPWDAPFDIAFVAAGNSGTGQDVFSGVAVGAIPPADTAAGPNWTEMVFRVWIAGAAIGLLAMLAGAARLGGIAFRARPIEDRHWRELSAEIAARHGLRRPVRLLESRSGLTGTWGIRTHHVLLPDSARAWPVARMRVVLTHELAHARRHDWVFQVLADAARSIYWFNPLFWVAAERLRVESELAADDAVLLDGTKRAEYAGELLDLARSVRKRRAGLLPVLGMAHRSHIERRIASVLNPSLGRLAATPLAVAVIIAVAIGLTLPLAAVRTGSPAASLPPESAASLAPEPAASLPPEPAPPTAAGRMDSGDTVADDPAPAPCPTTPVVRETPPEGEMPVDALGSGPWYVNEDRTLWVWQQPWSAGDMIHTVWVRPPGERLVLSGRRIDGGDEGNPPGLNANVTPAGTLAFKASALLFPTPGCWEVTASAGASELVFVTEVGP